MNENRDSESDATERSIERALAGQWNDRIPIWLMRQAGRYLPEYRKSREKAGSFLDLCFNPELAAEVTLQPIRRFDFDAAILFSDILVIPYALGRRVAFLEGEGPVLDPITRDEIDGLGLERIDERLSPVLETVGRVREGLAKDKSLIGFCGAPFTVATYMVAGKGTRDQEPARSLAYREPEVFGRLVDVLVEASSRYLIAQIKAGADVVQIFDSWAGILPDDEFFRWSIEPTARMVESVRAACPGARIIGFPKGAGLRLEAYVVGTGVDGIGIDWTVPLSYARGALQNKAAVQGNLDPLLLMAGGERLDRGIEEILEGLGEGPFIFNLGHGILQQTPISNVERLAALVRRWRRG